MSSDDDAPVLGIRVRRFGSHLLLTQFEQLKITQNPPTESEVALARSLVSRGRTELKELRLKIERPQSREKALQKYVSDHQRIVFSINRFPPEILSLIFLCTLSPELIDKPVHTESPWSVSQVCKLWRDVSLSSQRLWASPKIHRVPNQSPSQLHLHLARSGNARLHPILAGSTRPDRFLPRLLTALITHCERWVTLLLTIRWTQIPEQFAFVKGRVGQLESLHIEGVWLTGGNSLDVEHRLDTFAVAPRLRTVSVKYICEPAISLVLPWHQLTQYSAIGNGHEHLAVLALCPNLVVADLSFHTLPRLADDEPVVLQLPRLVQITLGDAEFLRVLSLPALRHVILQKTAPEDDALLPLLALARRSRPPLSSISIVHSALVTATLAAVLAEAPQVDTLRLHIRRGDTAAMDELVARLTISPHDDDALAPNLTTLELIGRGRFNQARFVDMVQLRCLSIQSRCVPFRKVILRMTPKSALAPNTVERLRGLVAVTLAPLAFFSDDLTPHFASFLLDFVQ